MTSRILSTTPLWWTGLLIASKQYCGQADQYPYVGSIQEGRTTTSGCNYGFRSLFHLGVDSSLHQRLHHKFFGAAE